MIRVLLEATRRIRAARPDASVVMLAASIDRYQVLEAVEVGAVGYLVKDAEPGTLLDGVRAAANGDSPLWARDNLGTPSCPLEVVVAGCRRQLDLDARGCGSLPAMPAPRRAQAGRDLDR